MILICIHEGYTFQFFWRLIFLFTAPVTCRNSQARIEPTPQQQPKLLQVQFWILSLPCQKRTLRLIFLKEWIQILIWAKNSYIYSIIKKSTIKKKFFLGPHLWHMEVPRVGVELELQLPALATATARRDLSHVCDLHHSSQQRRILNSLSRAPRDWAWILMDISWVHVHWAMREIPERKAIFWIFCVVCFTSFISIQNIKGYTRSNRNT